MLIELILFLLMGVFAGTFSGLFPGIHINLIGIFIVSLSISLLSSLNPIYFIVFITAMAITHTFVDFIPSIFLGCPDTDTELSILPGHTLLKKGQGYAAIMLACYGNIIGIFGLILLSFPLIIIVSKTYNFLQTIMPYLLITVSGILLSLEKRKIVASGIFFLTGILGFLVLNLELTQPLLPLLTGLFGASGLIISIKNKTQIPTQKISKIKTSLSHPIIGALIASPLCGFLPGLGSGQAAIMGNTISKNNNEEFLVLLGATNTLVMGISFLSLYIISKARTGAAVAIQEILGKIPLEILILILITTTVSGILSFFLTKHLAKFFSKKITKISYRTLSVITLIVLSLVVLAISSLFGFLIFILSTVTGIYSINQKVRRTNMMGCLLIPTIILYLL